MEKETIKIFWEDISARKQQEILDAFGENCNFDIFPIAEIPVEVEDEEDLYESYREDEDEDEDEY